MGTRTLSVLDEQFIKFAARAMRTVFSTPPPPNHMSTLQIMLRRHMIVG